MNLENQYIHSNIDDIKRRIVCSTLKVDRSPDEINIIAVTKTVNIEKIKAAIQKGINNLGENRVQELLEKYDNIKENCKWHIIGHLQTNKVKYIIDKVSMVHSVDRLELAEELQSRAEKIGKVVEILIQVNVSGEESKFGISPLAVMDFVKKISTCRNIKVKGLMTIAPFTKIIEETRPVFRSLKEIFIDIKRENIDNVDMDLLSMGMSNDFEIAIEEGANFLRIGTAIFGKREY